MNPITLIRWSALACLAFSQTAPFSQDEVNEIYGYFTKNVNISGGYEGAIIAATSNSNPNYYFHWMRDAGLCMRVIYDTTSSSTFDPYFQSYAKWVANAQVATDPNNIDVRGEPKWYIKGTPYDQGWCRPQNDGPGIRAYVLSMYGQWGLANGRSSYVTSTLFGNSSQGGSCNPSNSRTDCGYYGITEDECTGKGCCWSPVNPNPQNLPWCFYENGQGGATGLIPTDLEYVQAMASSSGTCDLWEEYQAMTFFTSMVQRKGLYEGARLAKQLGFTSIATSYQQTIATLNTTITQLFYQPSNNLVIQSNERTWDSAVILGSIYGDTGDLFGPTNSAILNTAAQTREWSAENFPINIQDDNDGIPGTLIARYANDKYDGCASNGGSAGHAWILSTNAFASLYYLNGLELAKALREGNHWKELIDSEKLRLYAKHFSFDMPQIATEVLEFAENWHKMTDKEKRKATEYTVRSLTQSGDNILTRVHYHVSPCSCRMTEQICETTGNEIGATDLSWAYATFLSAWYSRGQLVDTYGYKPFPEFEKFYSMKRFDGFGDSNCNGCNDGCSN